MNKIVQIPEHKASRLEKFGLYYLNLFKRIDNDQSVFEFTDAELSNRVKKITRKGIVLSSLIGIICVFPIVWVDVYFANSSFLVHYGWVASVTVITIIIEFYLLFVIALKAVYEVSDLINMHSTQSELLEEGCFSVKNLLARAALELPDPELKILGIDPFKRISKKNLLIISLLYKAKIIVTNLVLKFGLKFTVGDTVGGVSILYEALPVECFWNSVVIKRVVHEARLRMFGFALAHRIANDALNDKLPEKLSPLARTGCLRAIGNAVVMTQNYHPNMIILLLRFQQVLQITEENKYDDWDMFLETLKNVNEKERHFLLDIFTISVAFDGKLSRLEQDHLREAYGDDFDLYYPRLVKLIEYLQVGKLNAALDLCRLEMEAG